MPYKLIIERIWSNNIFLPKASIVRHKYAEYNNDIYYYSLPTNKHGKYCFRFRLKIIKENA